MLAVEHLLVKFDTAADTLQNRFSNLPENLEDLTVGSSSCANIQTLSNRLERRPPLYIYR